MMPGHWAPHFEIGKLIVARNHLSFPIKVDLWTCQNIFRLMSFCTTISLISCNNWLSGEKSHNNTFAIYLMDAIPHVPQIPNDKNSRAIESIYFMNWKFLSLPEIIAIPTNESQHDIINHKISRALRLH